MRSREPGYPAMAARAGTGLAPRPAGAVLAARIRPALGRIALYLALGVGTMLIFTFLWEWNDFLKPLIYLNSEENFTLSIAMRQWQGANNATGVMLAAKWVHIMAM